ncbi:hypothetical protein [Vibrio anguillarum]|uniref:hypothetical protein n=1 Tax=Vibrio anguillarum TaxID=55601 RepID=UPI0030EC9C1B
MNKLTCLIYFMTVFCLPNIGGIYFGEILTVVILLYVVVTRKVTISIDIYRCMLIGYLILCATIALSIYSFIYNLEGSLYYAFRFARFIFWLFSIYLIKDVIVTKYNYHFLVNFIFPTIFSVHALAIIITYLDVAGARIFLMTLSQAEALIPQYFRASGLWGGFDSASVFMSFGIIYTLVVHKANVFIRAMLVVLFTLASFLTSARVGFALLAFFFVVFICLKARAGKILPVIYVIFSMFGLLLTLSLMINFGGDYLPEDFLSTANRMSEVFVNKGSTTSTDHLITMYYLPDTFSILFFGNSLDSFSGLNSVSSDVEYIKFIWGVGLPLSIVIFSYTIFVFFLLPKKNSRNNDFLLLLPLLVSLTFLGSFKGEYIFAFRYVPLFMWFLWLSQENCKSIQPPHKVWLTLVN